MKLRLTAVAFVAALIAGCSWGDYPAPPSASRDPYAGLPSNACGGFHLKVVNQLSESVRLTIDADWTDVVEAGGTETVTQFLTQPMPPPLPWLVEIYDATGRVTLFRQTMSGPVDQKVTLSEGSAAATPYSLQDEGC